MLGQLDIPLAEGAEQGLLVRGIFAPRADADADACCFGEAVGRGDEALAPKNPSRRPWLQMFHPSHIGATSTDTISELGLNI